MVGQAARETEREDIEKKIESEKNFIRNSDDKAMEIDYESCETGNSVYLQSFEEEERKNRIM